MPANDWGGGTFDFSALEAMWGKMTKVVVMVRIVCSYARYEQLLKAVPPAKGPTELLAFSGLPIHPSHIYPHFNTCHHCGGTGDGTNHPHRPATYCVTCKGCGTWWTDGVIEMSDDTMRFMMRYSPVRFQPRWPIDIKVPLREIPAQR